LLDRGRPGEQAADSFLHGTHVVAGREVAGADRAASAPAGAFEEFGFFGPPVRFSAHTASSTTERTAAARRRG
jgi:hypothetical protein